MSECGTSVWTGRVLKAGCDRFGDDWSRSSVFGPLNGASRSPAIMDIRAHPISFASRPWKAVCATRSRTRRWDRFSISSIQLADLGGSCLAINF